LPPCHSLIFEKLSGPEGDDIGAIGLILEPMSKNTLEFPHIWNELMEQVGFAVAAGESRREVMAWAQSEYDAYVGHAHSEMYGPPEPTWDAAW